MIILLVPRGKPLQMLQMTRPRFVQMVREIGENGHYLATLPPRRASGDFEQAWLRYTSDMKCARYFEDVAAALAHYEETRDGLSTMEHARVLKMLHETPCTV